MFFWTERQEFVESIGIRDKDPGLKWEQIQVLRIRGEAHLIAKFIHISCLPEVFGGYNYT